MPDLSTINIPISENSTKNPHKFSRFGKFLDNPNKIYYNVYNKNIYLIKL